MVKQYKVDKVETLRAKLDSAKGVFLADFQGMDVAMATELRNRCREAGVEFEVVKNTLTRRAIDQELRSSLDPFLVGPTAIATSDADEITPAKIMADFLKEFEKPTLKAGIVDGRVIDQAQVKVLASLPSKEVLIAQFMGALKSPLQKLHGTLSTPMRNLASVLKQVSEREAQ